MFNAFKVANDEEAVRSFFHILMACRAAFLGFSAPAALFVIFTWPHASWWAWMGVTNAVGILALLAVWVLAWLPGNRVVFR